MQYNEVNGRFGERRKAIDSGTFREPSQRAWPSTVWEPSVWRWLR